MLWNAIHALGYTVLRNQQAEQAWAIDVQSADMESDAQFVSIYARTKPFTMTTMSRMYALYKATEYVTKGHITGDIVECGVWRGGSSMLVALALQVYGVRDRNLYLYDTFDGMPQPTEHDI